MYRQKTTGCALNLCLIRFVFLALRWCWSQMPIKPHPRLPSSSKSGESNCIPLIGTCRRMQSIIQRRQLGCISLQRDIFSECRQNGLLLQCIICNTNHDLFISMCLNVFLFFLSGMIYDMNPVFRAGFGFDMIWACQGLVWSPRPYPLKRSWDWGLWCRCLLWWRLWVSGG